MPEREGLQSSTTTLLNLNHDWIKHDNLIHSKDKLLKGIQKNSIQISHNKAPLVFSESEANSLFEMEISETEMRQFQFLSRNTYVLDLMLEAMKNTEQDWPKAEELEQMIYQNFVSKNDLSIALDLRNSESNKKLSIIDKLGDQKLKI